MKSQVLKLVTLLVITVLLAVTSRVYSQVSSTSSNENDIKTILCSQEWYLDQIRVNGELRSKSEEIYTLTKYELDGTLKLIPIEKDSKVILGTWKMPDSEFMIIGKSYRTIIEVTNESLILEYKDNLQLMYKPFKGSRFDKTPVK